MLEGGVEKLFSQNLFEQHLSFHGSSLTYLPHLPTGPAYLFLFVIVVVVVSISHVKRQKCLRAIRGLGWVGLKISVWGDSMSTALRC